jgi:hypothetical protein
MGARHLAIATYASAFLLACAGLVAVDDVHFARDTNEAGKSDAGAEAGQNGDAGLDGSLDAVPGVDCAAATAVCDDFDTFPLAAKWPASLLPGLSLVDGGNSPPRALLAVAAAKASEAMYLGTVFPNGLNRLRCDFDWWIPSVPTALDQRAEVDFFAVHVNDPAYARYDVFIAWTQARGWIVGEYGQLQDGGTAPAARSAVAKQPPRTETWLHVTFTMDAGSAALYIDSALVAELDQLTSVAGPRAIHLGLPVADLLSTSMSVLYDNVACGVTP